MHTCEAAIGGKTVVTETMHLISECLSGDKSVEMALSIPKPAGRRGHCY